MEMKYKVWNTKYETEEDAQVIETDDPAYAAEIYADDDCDGLSEGSYQKPEPINVRDPEGVLHLFDVEVEYEPTFWVSKREPKVEEKSDV